MKDRTMLLAAGLGSLVAATALAATASADCPQFRCTADHVGTAATSLTAGNVASLGPSWAFRTGAAIHGSPAVRDGVVYAGSEDGDVYAVDASTGAQRWAFRTGGAVWSTPAVQDKLAVFGSADDSVYAVDAATGRQRWRFPTGGDVTGSPAVAGGVVFVGSNDHRVYALDLATGRQRWATETGDRVSGSPLVSGGVVYIGSNDDRLYALDAATGKVRWSRETDAWVWSSPVLADGRVLFNTTGSVNSGVSAGHGGSMNALTAADGVPSWTGAQPLNSTTSPVAGGGVVIATGYTAITAFDPASGAVRWSDASPTDTNTFSSPFLANGVVYALQSAGGGNGTLVALNQSDGSQLARFGLPTLNYGFSGPVVSGDRVYFGDGWGVLHAYAPNAASDKEVAATPPPAPELAYSHHRDVLANMLDPGSVAELRQPGDGVIRVANTQDPTGLNHDDTNFHGYTKDGRRILMDVRGAGVLTDFYMYDGFGSIPGGLAGRPYCEQDPAGLEAPKIALYVDDAAKPLFDVNGKDLYCGKVGFPFLAPVTGQTAGSQWSHVPVPFRRHLFAVMDSAPTQSAFWYDFYYTKFPDDRGVQTFDPVRDRARYQALLDRWGALGTNPYPKKPSTRTVKGIAELAPGKSAKLLDVHGGGRVTSIRFDQFTSDPPVETTPNGSQTSDTRDAEPLRATQIVGTWDDAQTPQVRAPVDEFFGTGFGQAQDYDSIMAGMHTATGVLPQDFPHPTETSTVGKPGGVSTYEFWPMPYGDHADISLSNTLPAGGATVSVAYEITYEEGGVTVDRDGHLHAGQEELGYFHAQRYRNRSKPGNSPHPERNANDAFARLEGRGNYAGHVLDMTNNTSGAGVDTLSYMEGDCMFWVDDAPDYLPDITSTGHEECHDAPAYFEYDANNPTANTTLRDVCGVTIAATCTGEASVFHWWMGDTIAFQKRFEATVEHGSENTYNGSPTNPGVLADESGTAFYYLEPNPAVVLPSSRSCVSRRSFRIRLRVPRQRRVRRAAVYVGRKRVAVRRGRRLTAPIDLRGLPPRRVTVTIKLTLASGRTVTEHRAYRTCVKRRGA